MNRQCPTKSVAEIWQYRIVLSLIALMYSGVAHAFSGGTYYWNMGLTGAKIVHESRSYGTSGYGTSVAVIDGLVDCRHWDFMKWAPGVTGANCSSVGLPGARFPGYDDHGTHVASIIGARGSASLSGGVKGYFTGMAPNTTILGYGLLGSYTGAFFNAEDIAVADAHARGARAVNMSYTSADYGYMFSHYYTERMFILMPQYKNMVFVRAAGNEGIYLRNETYVSYSPAATQDPSVDLSNLMIVGAVDAGRRTTWFSNAPGESCFLLPGETVCQEKNKYKYFFIVAPGQNIHGAVSNGKVNSCWFASNPPTPRRDCSFAHKNMSGTSMAAPHVAGAVALLHGRWPVLKENAIATANILFTTADDLGEPGVDGIYGWGFLRIDKAFSPLGAQYMFDGSKRYPWGLNQSATSISKTSPASQLMLSSALREISHQAEYVSVFDSYDRDFRLPLLASQRNLSNTLHAEMGLSGFESKNVELSRVDNGPWSFEANASVTDHPIPDDLFWSLSVSNKLGTTEVGYGKDTSWYYQPEGLALVRPEVDVTTSGVNPILQLAKNGTHISNRVDLSKQFYLTTSYAVNDSVFNPDSIHIPAEVFVLSATSMSNGQRWGGNITVAQLNEKSGLFGSQMTGAFTQGDGFETTSLTVGSDWKIGSNYVVSSSYTMARSNAGNGERGLLQVSNRITSDAFAVGLKGDNFFRDGDQVFVSLSQPLRITDGSATLAHIDYFDATGAASQRIVDIDLAPSAQEIDIQLGYASTLGNAITIKAFCYLAQNYNQVAGSRNSGVVVRLERSF